MEQTVDCLPSRLNLSEPHGGGQTSEWNEAEVIFRWRRSKRYHIKKKKRGLWSLLHTKICELAAWIFQGWLLVCTLKDGLVDVWGWEGEWRGSGGGEREVRGDRRIVYMNLYKRKVNLLLVWSHFLPCLPGSSPKSYPIQDRGKGRWRCPGHCVSLRSLWYDALFFA